MPPQSFSAVMLLIELYPTRTSLISEELKTWLQLSARLRKGASVRPPGSSANAVFSVLIVSSAIEKRRKSLSLADAFQSSRRSPWWARVVLRESLT